MKATINDSHSTQNNPRKGVNFDTMETLERNSNCIDRLTSLVSDMKMTIDRKQPPYKPRIYQGRSRESKCKIGKILHPKIDPIEEEKTRVEIEEIIEIIIGPIIEIDQEADGPIIGQVIGVTIIRITIDKVMSDPTTDKMPNGHLETEVIAEIDLKIIIMTIQEVEVETDIITDPYSQGKTHYLMEEMNLGLDLTLE